MLTDNIPFKDTGYFSKLICDYLDEKEDLKPFYSLFPSIENFKSQIEEKQSSFKNENRVVLYDVLKKQYKGLNTSETTQQNIEALKQKHTFTITTGHQLNLFTGPLYFLFKIVSTINLTRELKSAYPEYNFVPVYWMATEDHDFDEINFFNFKGKKIQWNRDGSGAVGEFSNEGLDKVFDIFSKEIGQNLHAETLKQLFKDAYLDHDNLAEATRFLANELFSNLGLVILDANTKDLKREFIPFIEKELTEQLSFKHVSETNKKINALSNKEYSIQVNPREINLFYLTKGLRERIVYEDEKYKVLNTKFSWSKSEILKHVNKMPERFSPNVILRPLYQEVVLPNLCYIGGGGELAYWLQLKSNFVAHNVTFPILLLRNSVLIKTKQQTEKLNKLNISSHDMFLKQDAFVNKRVRDISNIDIDFTPQMEYLQKQFKELFILAEQTDKSFIGAVKAQEMKQLKGLKHLEKRLIRAQKRKLSEQVSRIVIIQDELFPNKSLQERQSNFSEFYLQHGELLIQQLVLNLQPLKAEFLILNLD